MTTTALKPTPKFLVVRYAHGSAGKFLLSLLMLSQHIAHFDQQIENNKSYGRCRDWIKKKFTADIKNWLQNEPKPVDAWNLHFVSNTHDRGNDISHDDFLKLCKSHATDYFWHSVNQGQYIPVVWHKHIVPDFYKNSKFITIIIDKKSKKWYHRALWYKHYNFDNNTIYFKTHNNLLNSKNMSQYYTNYENIQKEHGTFISLVKKHIINSSWIDIFGSTGNFEHQTTDQLFVNLSNIIDPSLFCCSMDNICEFLDIEKINHNHLTLLHRYWLLCHDFKYR